LTTTLTDLSRILCRCFDAQTPPKLQAELETPGGTLKIHSKDALEKLQAVTNNAIKAPQEDRKGRMLKFSGNAEYSSNY